MVSLIYTRGGQDKLIRADVCASESHTATAVISKHPVDRGVNVADHVRPDNDVVTLELWFSNTPLNTQQDDFFSGSVGTNQSVSLEVASLPRRLQPPTLIDPGQSPKSLKDLSAGGISLVNFMPNVGPIATGTVFTLASVARLPGRIPKWKASEEVSKTPNEKATVLKWSKAFDRAQAVFSELLLIRNNALVVQIVTTLRTYDNMIIVGLNPTRDPATGNVLKVTLDAEQIRVVTSETVAVAVATPVQRKQKGAQPTKVAETPTQEKNASLAYSMWH